MEQKIFDWFANNIDVSLTDSQWQDIRRFVKSQNESDCYAQCGCPASNAGWPYSDYCTECPVKGKDSA